MTVLTIKTVGKLVKVKENFSDNHVHNILRLILRLVEQFFSFTAGEMKHDH